MFCDQCGQQNADGDVYCTQCGRPLRNVSPAAASTHDGSAAASAPAYVASKPMTPSSALPGVDGQTDRKATLSLTFGILSFAGLSFLTIPGIILGHMSRSRIRKSGGKLKGEGKAMAGLVLGYSHIAIVVLIVAAIAIPNLGKGEVLNNEAAARASLRDIMNASNIYQAREGTYPTDLEALKRAELLEDAVLATGVKSGYRFTCIGNEQHYFVLAQPTVPGKTGAQTFCATDDAIIRSTQTREECTPNSPPWKYEPPS